MKKVLIIILCIIAVALVAWGYICYINDKNAPLGEIPFYKHDVYSEGEFIGRVLEEDLTYVIVEPNSGELERKIAEKIKVNFVTPHKELIYGKERNILIKYNTGWFDENELIEITTDEIYPNGYEQYVIKVKESEVNEKKLVANSRDIFVFDKDYDFYFYGLDEVNVEIAGETMPILDALKSFKLTFNQMLINGNNDFGAKYSYDDGGSIEFPYEDYTIIKFNSVDGNGDFYICKKGTVLTDLID